jgi:2-dehydro-3-deoxy-D-arabinonate dehydratase
MLTCESRNRAKRGRKTMLLARYVEKAGGGARVGVLEPAGLVPLTPGLTLAELLRAPDPAAAAVARREAGTGLETGSYELLAPIDGQEVWGAGVTYERSKVARQEESDSAATFYDLVYRADRPELFFKATPGRVVGPGRPIRIRADSSWSVPEPELALVLTPELNLAGFTIGNDVSARDIEGRNPLYLPQAKVYDACCALGPAVCLASTMPDPTALAIRLRIVRGGAVHWEGETSTTRMARSFAELVDWLGRENRFPDGVILLTGTGVVPPDAFSLAAGDTVEIEVDGIGVLSNPVIQG